MTRKQVENVINSLKAQGYSEEDILGSFYAMFADDKMSLEELEDIVKLLGYELNDEFKALSPEEQKTKGYEEKEDEVKEGVTKEVVEDAKEITPNETKKEVAPAKNADEEEEKEAKKLFGLENNKKAKKEKDDDEDEDEEEKQAKKLFGL